MTAETESDLGGTALANACLAQSIRLSFFDV